jgi:AcrR family transcriptional regulator
MKINRRSQAERSAATRTALVKAARPLFAQHGFSGVGTESIVAAAGVTRGALYHQFAGKTELFAAVYEAIEEDLARGLGELIAATGVTDPIEVMSLGANAWLDACGEQEVQQIVLLDGPAVLGWAD